MKTSHILGRPATLLLLLSSFGSEAWLFAQGTAFTYQGRLDSSGNPVTGLYDIRFTVYDSTNDPGTLIGGPLTNSATPVSNGLFTVTLDFGAGVFTGADRWLEIWVRTNGTDLFTTLTPRQPLTPTPYAITAANVISGGLAAGTYGNAYTFNNPANSFAGDGGGLTNVNASTLSGFGSSDFWQLGGNSVSGSQFFGTTNNQALEIRVNNMHALRLVPTSVPSLEGGYLQNSTHGATSAVIVGGGMSGSPNEVFGNYGFVGAGHGAKVGGFSAVVGGGYNVAVGQFSFVGSGLGNTNQADYSCIGAGSANYIGPFATNGFIGGGFGNIVADFAANAFIGGGFENIAWLQLTTVGGGQQNTASYPGATIGGGATNYAVGTFATVGGGSGNWGNSDWATVGGGLNNIATGSFSKVGGGANNGVVAEAGTVGGGARNWANGDYGSIGGGQGNYVSDMYGTISGGYSNSAASAATVGGGVNNHADVNAATVNGGSENRASGDHSTISGGQANSVAGPYTAVGGGVNNTVGADVFGSTISGGSSNTISTGAFSSIIGGGTNNLIGPAGPFATIAGGANNISSGEGATVSGGGVNHALDQFAAIGGGYGNIALYGATVAGGEDNLADAPRATIGGGVHNEAGGDSAFVGGGEYNTAIAEGSVVGGGGFDGVLFSGNRVNAACATISGGIGNSAENNYAFIGGGRGNTNQAYAGAVSGGWFNLATGNGAYASLGGGISNIVSAYYATVPGGLNNVAAGTCSLAAGQQAYALHQGAFVWADSQPAPFASTTNDQFSIRARGGVRFNEDTSLFFGTDPPRQVLNLWGTQYGIGVQSLDTYFRTDTSGAFFWYAGGSYDAAHGNAGGGTRLMQLDNAGLTVNGTFVSLSDRNVKEHLEPVNSREVLEKLVALPVSTWNYKTDPTSRHLGPMAQDFYAAFHIGPDDKHIATVDEGGVALAAIQGLNQKLQERDAAIQALREKNESLEKRLSELEAAIKQALSRK